MARVIAEAKDNPELWRMKITCTCKGWNDNTAPCYRLLEIDATDIYKRTHTSIDQSTDVYYGFICPMCGTFTEISEASIPDYVKNHALKYEDRPKTGLDFAKRI